MEPIGNHLKQGQLKELQQKAKQLGQLTDIFHRCIPASLHAECYVAAYDQGRMVVVLENTAMTFKLRLEGPRLVDQLQAYPECKDIQSLVWRPMPRRAARIDAELPSDRPVKANIPLSASKAFKGLSERVSSPELAKALKRLSQKD